ncbi:uncharacterized protein LOC103375386, partial [Stegastes partitus]|uniref:Uncharacterized protein LOC103375386 n=1 Tax=Stegastes partitus TaxID=144197 RepID=A0A9Y4NV95_9TELE
MSSAEASDVSAGGVRLEQRSSEPGSSQRTDPLTNQEPRESHNLSIRTSSSESLHQNLFIRISPSEPLHQNLFIRISPSEPLHQNLSIRTNGTGVTDSAGSPPAMNGGRGVEAPPAGPTGSPRRAARPRANRLSRRQTQAEEDSPRRPPSDFKTPTRVLRSRPAAGFSADSPQNDGDLQQDIIWDAASPSPRRLGKRGKKQTAGVVDISEIVSRIAPKHGRPTVAEPTLQQWIGDSATIPCTPDLQPPRPRKKSPRPNAVEDLLKLARQFDLNLFHQDEEEEEEENQNQQNPELLSEEVLVFGSTAARPDVQLRLDQHLEDDLDLLFDGPTQQVSRHLSQASPVGAALASSRGPTEFEDDWENDDLLNDSLLLEMTQNPQNFAAPKHCSTQKPNQVTPAAAGATSQPAGSRVGKENLWPRPTFKLETHPGFSARGILTDTRTEQQNSGTTARDGRFPDESGSQLTKDTCWWNTVKPEPQNPEVHQKLSAGSSKSAASSTTQRKPAASSNLDQDLDQDLDSLFSLDPVWDDPTDDDLLCEMCEHLENQIHGLDKVLSNQRAALQPTSRTWDNPIQPPQKHSAGPSGPSLSSVQSQHHVIKENFTFKRPINPVSMTTNYKAKCSAAEIELKKQQAMDRRRQRLQAQNLQAPTRQSRIDPTEQNRIS